MNTIPAACIFNVPKVDLLHGKLASLLFRVTFDGVDKHTSLLRNLYIMSSSCFVVQTPGAGAGDSFILLTLLCKLGCLEATEQDIFYFSNYIEGAPDKVLKYLHNSFNIK